jgi:type II secretory pathway pseudopilin PulG
MHPTSLRLGQHTATQRGVTLLEILLATGLFAAALVLIFSIITDQQRDAQNKIVAANMKDVLEASQTYVQANWDELLVDLADSAALGGVAVLEFDVGDLVTEGYLGAAFLNNAAGDNAQNLFEQEYRVLARGVDIADTANPQDTVTTADLAGADADTNGIRDDWEDDDPANGEFAIEAILVTTGGQAVSPVRGNPIAVHAGGDTGFIQVDGLADGALGGWSMDLTPYAGFGVGYTDAGHFVGLVALSGYGDLETGGSVDTSTLLSRVPVARDNAMHQVLDMGSNNIQGVRLIDLRYDSNGDGINDLDGTIGSLGKVRCTSSTGAAVVGAELLFDCNQVRMNGQLTVDKNTILKGQLTVTADTTGNGVSGDPNDLAAIVDGNLRADNLQFRRDNTSAGPGVWQDLSEGIYDAQIVASGDLVTKPTCGRNGAGTTMSPRIYLVPVAYADSAGRRLVGATAFAENASATAWRARLYIYVDQDTQAPIGQADSFEVDSTFGRVLAMTRCF